jgi:hypothetical protein
MLYSWELFLTTKKTLDEVKDIFLFVESESLVEIKELIFSGA